MIGKFTALLGLLAATSAYPVTYVTQEQAARLQAAAPQPQYRYVQQAQPSATYQQEAQPQQQQVVYQQAAPAQRTAYQQPQPQQQVVYQQPQQVQQRPRKLRPAPQRVPIGPDGNPAEEQYDPPSPYQFSFDVRDDLNTNYQNRKEQREGDVITGSYSVVDSDGFIRTVKYTADPLEGFKAEVTREPTDIKVLVPTPPPAQLTQRQQQTQQYLEAAPQYQQPQAQVYNSLAQPQQPQQQYVRRPAAARAPARQQYVEQASEPQYVSAAAPAPRAKPAAYYAPEQAARYQTYAQQ